MNWKRVLVTGGAGLVGSHIVDLLVQERIPEIIVLDNLSRGRRESLRQASGLGNVRLVEGDLQDRSLVHELSKGADVIFHQAALRITHSAEDPRLAMEVLVDGTFNVVEAAKRSGVQKIVAASSASVYGLAEVFPTPETHHGYGNGTLYGAAKLFNEGLLRSYYQMYGLNYVALRYFNVYGPRMDVYGAYTEVLIRWMEALADNKPLKIFGDGTQTMDFIYIEDIARANLLAAQANVTDEVFNIASGVETSLNDLASRLTNVMGKNLRPEYHAPRKVNPVTRRLADTRKASAQLGFDARVSLDEGLSRLVSWWQQHQHVSELAQSNIS